MKFDEDLQIVRRPTRKVKVGNIFIGGDAPIAVQTMTKTKTDDTKATIEQIHLVQQAGADLVRVAVPDEAAAKSLGWIRLNIQIPLVADIHFNAKFAMIALEQGVDKLRLNPGNIRNEAKIRDIVKAAKERSVPIRIGVNAGSLDPDIKEKYGLTPRALIESAKRELSYFDKEDFGDVIISLKASDVRMTIAAYRLAAEELGDYPLHLGVTEAGLTRVGTVKSAMGMGTILSEGIGDTLRVSLTGDPVEEVKVGWDILQGLELRRRGVNVISCPSCGRCDIDVVPLAGQVADAVGKITIPISVAVMGCEVNGPGEAKSADYGIAGGNGISLIFKKGEIVARAKPHEQLDTLMNVINEDLAKETVKTEE
ncbi:MAG: flavodoxin-dependent (E)-4-hydroxy-3-methylbut-2-enyl-diphosphate synthase [Abitibacteriaceae bacterium]|nr:flavodoxin-dependent (E)-4-hydroxy-3-methylbut-2-enyl-diphosphate synthase [Abditibacteriaceae bacterium]